MSKILNIKGEEVDREKNPYTVQLREEEPERINAEVYFLLKSYLKDCFPKGYLVYMCKVDTEETCTEILKSGLVFGRNQGLDVSMPRVFDSQSKYSVENEFFQGDWKYFFNSINKQLDEGNNVVLAVFERLKLPYMAPIAADYSKIEIVKKIDEKNILGYITNKNKFYLSQKFVDSHSADKEQEKE